MSNSYETMYILRPDLSEEQARQASEKYINFISERGATDIKIQNRGKRRLAYEIQNFQDGIYIQMNYIGNGDFIKLMERDMRLSEEVIRYLTLKIETNTTPSEEEEEVVDRQPSQPAPVEDEQPSQPAPPDLQPAPTQEQPSQPAPVEDEQPSQPAPVEEQQ